MSVINFDSKNLKVDWIFFNLEGLIGLKIIASRLLNYLSLHILIDEKPGIKFCSFSKKYKISNY